MGCCVESSNQEDIGQRNIHQNAVGNGISNDQLDHLNFGGDLSQRLMLTISAKNLPNLDKRSKTDAYCVITEVKPGNQRTKVGQTEVILDSMNPDFVTTIEIDFRFEENQQFVIELYDADDMNQLHNLQAQQLIGGYNFSLHNIVTKPHQTALFNLTNKKIPKMKGQVNISAVEKRADHGQTECQFDVTITNPGYQASSSLFFILYQTQMSGGTKPVYKSENQKCLKNQFKFGRVFSNTDSLANSIDTSEILIKFFQFSSSGNHKEVFKKSTNLGSLNVAALQQTNLVMDNSGIEITLDRVLIQKRVTFLDYIFGGCEISLQVAVDFTASNGKIDHPQSLHFINNGQPNQYMHAIMSVGSILEQYDTDKLYPVYGFGGKIMETGAVSHCFALNGNIFRPECHGVEGILNVYQHAIHRAPLSGPTNFAPILQYVAGYCYHKMQEMSQYNQQYTILLILTDGAIMDMQQTIDEIVNASGLPLSVIIVGVGQADFSSMHSLDADESPLFSTKIGSYASRDITQFVPYLRFSHDSANLAREVLREIPNQILRYFQTNRIQPNMQLGDALANQPKPADSYFDIRKAQMVELAAQQNMDPAQAQAFLDNIGIAEYNINSIFKNANNLSYVNQLKGDF